MTVMESGTSQRNNIKLEIEKAKTSEAFLDLRTLLMEENSYWAVKAKILTAQASKQVPLKMVKCLELEMALKYKLVKEVISLADYFYKNHGDDEDFRKICTQRIHDAIGENKDSAFAEELQNSLNPQIFLDPLSSTRESPLIRIKKLVLLSTNPTVGLKKVGRHLMEQYTAQRSNNMEEHPLGLSPIDLIWFHLQQHLADQNLGEVTTEEAFRIARVMLQCCVADSVGLLKDSFYDVLNELGFSVPRPRDFWSAPLRVFSVILLQEQPTPSETAKFLERNIDSSNFVHISEHLIEHLDPRLDIELCKFLLLFAVTVNNACDGERIAVYLPGNVRDMSQRAIETHWKSVVGQRSFEPLRVKPALGEKYKQYDDALTVARNVFKACQRHNKLLDAQVEPTLRNALLNSEFQNGFSVIAQSLIVNGDMETAAQFIKLAIQTTKNQDEQKRLDLQLLQVYVALKRYTSAFKLFVDLFEDETEVSKVLESSTSIFPDIFLEENHLILLPKDQIYVYIVIMFMHTVFLVFVKYITLDRIKHIAASLILLSLQICYEIFDDKKIRSFLALCDHLDICFINVASLISKQHLMVHFVSSNVKCLQGKVLHSSVVEKRDMISNINKDGNGKNKLTPYRNVIVFLKEFKAVFSDL